MMGPRKRRRRRARPWKRAQEAIRRHPPRAILLAGLGMILAGLVVTKSLPYALAHQAPELALKLSASNPEALIALAERRRAQLLVLQQAEAAQKDVPSPALPASPPLRATGVPRADARRDDHAAAEERAQLKAEIRDLAKRAILNAPLNATAYRLLGELAEKPDAARALMQAAVGRSRRESFALFWLLNDAFVRKDYAGVVGHADTLLRTRPQLRPYVMRYLGALAADDDARKVLVARLIEKPPWRAVFFRMLPRSVDDDAATLRVMLDLKQAGEEIADEDLRPYLDFLISKGLMEAAYNAWLQMQPVASLAKLGLLTNADFEDEPSGLPFDWRLARGRNAVAEIVATGDGGDGKALHIAFGVGRITFPVVRQILVLPPGGYRLEGQLRGRLKGKRGLRWEIRCLKGARRVIAATDMLWGAGDTWSPFALVFEIPEGADCAGQRLRLIHDARSRSEAFARGSIWFDKLRLIRDAD